MVSGTLTSSVEYLPHKRLIHDGNQVVITYLNMSINTSTFDMEQVVVSFSGTQPSKDNMVLTGSVTNQNLTSSIDQYVLAGDFTLSRQ